MVLLNDLGTEAGINPGDTLTILSGEKACMISTTFYGEIEEAFNRYNIVVQPFTTMGTGYAR